MPSGFTIIRTSGHRGPICQSGPEVAVQAFQCGLRLLSFEHGDLLQRSEDLQPGIHTAPEEPADGSQECGDPMEHGSTVASITPQQHAIGTGSQLIDLKISGAFGYRQAHSPAVLGWQGMMVGQRSGSWNTANTPARVKHKCDIV
jgi:hypothetical protein